MIKTLTPTTGSTIACPQADIPSAAQSCRHTPGQPGSLSAPNLATPADQPVIIAKLEECPIDQLIPYHNNPRTHSQAQIRQIMASIQEFGFINPLLIAADHTVIAGHGRLQAARQLHMQTLPVIVLDHLTEAQCHALAIVDNQLPLNAGWDEEMLRRELALLQSEAYNLDLLGFDAAELKRVLAACDATQDLADAEAIPALPEVPVSAVGDLWMLGDHRLLCGDATCREALDTVLAGQTADMVFTDPPYNVGYEGKTAQKLTIFNDALGERFYEFLRSVCAHLIAVCRGAIYICMSSSELHTLYRAFSEAGGHWSTFLIWSKQHFTLGRSDYQRQYEPILYGWVQGGGHYWCGARDQADIWEIPRLMANREHPTAKPVELVERAIGNSSRPGATVLDPFAGSGTTLIACQRLQRTACLIEIDPRYADVICQRWQRFSGQAAVRQRDGRPFDQLVRDRQQAAA